MKHPHILIVEDELDLQKAYELILSSQGYIVSTANDGQEGMAKIKAAAPDLILLDLFMPHMNGRELLENLDMSLYPTTKIIVYSNLSDKGLEQEMLALGAHSVILKSKTGPKDLVELVKSVLND